MIKRFDERIMKIIQILRKTNYQVNGLPSSKSLNVDH